MRESRRLVTQKFKRIFIMILCFLSIIPSACSDKNASQNPESSQESTHSNSMTYTEITYPEEQSFFLADTLEIQDIEETNTYVMGISACADQCAVITRTMIDENSDYTTDLTFFDAVGAKISSYGLEKILGERNLQIICFDGSEMSLTLLAQVYDDASDQTSYCCFTVDVNGQLIFEKRDISFGDDFFIPDSLLIGDNGKIIISGYGTNGNTHLFFSADIEYQYKVQAENATNVIFQTEDATYVVQQFKNNLQDVFFLAKIDTQTGQVESSVEATDFLGDCVLFSSSRELYGADTNGIYRLDTGNQTKTLLMKWTDSYIDRSLYGYTSEIEISSDDLIWIRSSADPITNPSAWPVRMERQGENPLLGKERLVVGGFGISFDSGFVSVVQKFNQENEQYHIEIRDYESGVDLSRIGYEKECWQRMYLEIIEGEGPDLFYSSFWGQYSFYPLQKEEYLFDLSGIILSDERFKDKRLFPNIIDACTVDGELSIFPIHFMVQGIAGKSSSAESRYGWTIDEYEEIADSLPETKTMLLQEYSERHLLESAFLTSRSHFINEEEKLVHFDSNEFAEILLWAKEYGLTQEEIDRRSENFTDPIPKLLQGDILFAEAAISGINEYYYSSMNIFDEPACNMIGYPSPEREGMLILPSEYLAISSSSQNIEGALEFLLQLLSEEYQLMYSTDYNEYQAEKLQSKGFPICMDSMDTLVTICENPPAKPDTGGGDSPAEEEYTNIPSECSDKLLLQILNSSSVYYPDIEVLAIIQEEAALFFSGQKTAEEVANLIQNRVQLLVSEG